MQKFKLTRKESILFILPLLILGGVWWQSSHKSNLDSVLQKLAGPTAKDCSFSAMSLGEAKWKSMRECATDSFEAKRPFWSHDDYGADGRVFDMGVALGPEGNFYKVNQKRAHWFSSVQTEITRAVGTEVVTNPQTGERHIRSNGHVRVTNTP